MGFRMLRLTGISKGRDKHANIGSTRVALVECLICDIANYARLYALILALRTVSSL